MGKMYDLCQYVNTSLAKSYKKPLWALSDKEKRVVRYAEAYTKNMAVVAFLNNAAINKAVEREL